MKTFARGALAIAAIWAFLGTSAWFSHWLDRQPDLCPPGWDYSVTLAPSVRDFGGGGPTSEEYGAMLRDYRVAAVAGGRWYLEPRSRHPHVPDDGKGWRSCPAEPPDQGTSRTPGR